MRLVHLTGGALLAALVAVPSLASGQTNPPPSGGSTGNSPSIQIGATIFYDYTATTEPKSKDADGNTITSNAFNVTRSYINVTGHISDVVSFRLTPDITRSGDTGSTLNGALVFRIKYAYAQFDLSQWTGKWRNTFVRAGAQPTPYLDYMEGIYRYRFQGPIFAERESFEGATLLTSSDVGASFHTTFPGNFGDFHAGVYNGEGSTRAEANDQKSVQIRATVRPIAYSTSQVGGRSLGVTVFYDADAYQRSAARRRFLLSLTVEHKRLNAGFELLDAQDQPSRFRSEIGSRGWSFWATPFVKERGNGLEGLIRVDRFRPNNNLSGQEKQRVIAGIAYWFPHPGVPATAALLFDVERVTFSGFPSTPAAASQQRVAVHGLINF